MQYRAFIEIDLEADSPEEATSQAETCVQQICDESFCECARVKKVSAVDSSVKAEPIEPLLCRIPMCSDPAIFEGFLELETSRTGTAFRLTRFVQVCAKHKRRLVGTMKKEN